MTTLSQQYETINRFKAASPVDVEGLATALGVEVRYLRLDEGIAGFIEQPQRDQFAIGVNSADPVTRQRFTIAHEIGHFMLHRHLIGRGVDDDKMYRNTEARFQNTSIGRQQETEANRFAANVLMPYEAIERVKRERGTESPDVLATVFAVSRHAMHIRLGVPYP